MVGILRNSISQVYTNFKTATQTKVCVSISKVPL